MRAMLNRIDGFLGLTEKVFTVCSGVMMILILVIISANIVGRGFLGQGLVWAWPWAEVLFVWMVMVGFYVVYRQRRYMEIDFVARLCGEKGMLVTRVVSNLGIISMTGLIVFYAPSLLASQVGEIDIVGLPRYSLAIPMYVSAALVLLNSLVELSKTALGIPERSHGEYSDL